MASTSGSPNLSGASEHGFWNGALAFSNIATDEAIGGAPQAGSSATSSGASQPAVSMPAGAAAGSSGASQPAVPMAPLRQSLSPCGLPSHWNGDAENVWGYVKLMGAGNGEHYALPGVGEAPDFKVPLHAFKAQDLVGKYLVPIGWNEKGEYTFKREEPGGAVELSASPVSCFLPSEIKPGQEAAAIYSYGCLSRVADEDSVVRVKFALHEEKAPAIEVPCAEVDEVKTPRTPSSVGSDIQ